MESLSFQLILVVKNVDQIVLVKLIAYRGGSESDRKLIVLDTSGRSPHHVAGLGL
jgi:hypothetical protein